MEKEVGAYEQCREAIVQGDLYDFQYHFARTSIYELHLLLAWLLVRRNRKVLSWCLRTSTLHEVDLTSLNRLLQAMSWKGGDDAQVYLSWVLEQPLPQSMLMDSSCCSWIPPPDSGGSDGWCPHFVASLSSHFKVVTTRSWYRHWEHNGFESTNAITTACQRHYRRQRCQPYLYRSVHLSYDLQNTILSFL